MTARPRDEAYAQVTVRAINLLVIRRLVAGYVEQGKKVPDQINIRTLTPNGLEKHSSAISLKEPEEEDFQAFRRDGQIPKKRSPPALKGVQTFVKKPRAAKQHNISLIEGDESVDEEGEDAGVDADDDAALFGD